MDVCILANGMKPLSLVNAFISQADPIISQLKVCYMAEQANPVTNSLSKLLEEQK